MYSTCLNYVQDNICPIFVSLFYHNISFDTIYLSYVFIILFCLFSRSWEVPGRLDGNGEGWQGASRNPVTLMRCFICFQIRCSVDWPKGKKYREIHLIFMEKSMVSCRFSLFCQPIEVFIRSSACFSDADVPLCSIFLLIFSVKSSLKFMKSLMKSPLNSH